MDENWYCIYNCYGLCCCSGTYTEMIVKQNEIEKAQLGEAGSDGRKLKFHFLIKKDKFMQFLSMLMK